MDKYRKIDLSDWDLYRERSNSINYISKDGEKLLKCVPLNKEEKLDEYIEELNMYNKLNSLGMHTPAVYEIVDVGNSRHGIIYQFIKEKNSISRAVSYEPDKVEEYVSRYVTITKKMHSTTVPNNLLPRVEDRAIEVINKLGDKFLNNMQKSILLDFINSRERKDTLLHIDAHYGNVITTPNNDTYMIDTAMCAKGDPYYDIGFLYVFTLLSPEDATFGLFHVDQVKLKEMWQAYVKMYFNISTEEEIHNIEKKIKPYGLVAFINHALFLHTVEYQKYIVDHHFDYLFDLK